MAEGDRKTIIETLFAILGALLLIGVIVLLFFTYVLPQLQTYAGPKREAPELEAALQSLCFYHQASTGQSQVVIGGGTNIATFTDDYELTPLAIAQNMSRCFSDVPRGCKVQGAGGTCSERYEWEGAATIDYRSTCPFNHEEPGLFGHIVCSGGCPNFTRGTSYRLQVASTLASPTVSLPDFCLFYAEEVRP